MPTQRVDGTISTLAEGEIEQQFNDSLAVAAKRVATSRRAHTVHLQVTLSPTNVSMEILEIAHKIQIKDAAPKPQKAHAFVNKDTGELTVDLSVDPEDPGLAQKVIPGAFNQAHKTQSEGGTN